MEITAEAAALLLNDPRNLCFRRDFEHLRQGRVPACSGSEGSRRAAALLPALVSFVVAKPNVVNGDGLKVVPAEV